MLPTSACRQYFLAEQFLLKFGGLSLSGNETRIYRIYALVCLFLFIYGYPFIVSIDFFTQKFDDVVDSWFYGLGTTLAAVMITAMYPNRIKLGNLIKKLESKPFTVNKERGDEEHKLIKTWFSFNYIQRTAFGVGILTSIVSQIIYTLLKRMISNDYHDWNTGFARISIINVTYSPNYEIVWMYQIISLFYISCNMLSIVLITSGTLAFISAQFQILQCRLKKIVDNAQTRKKQETFHQNLSNLNELDDHSGICWECLQTSVKDAVDYHLRILDLASEIEEIFSGTMLSLYLFTLILVCIEVYRASMLPMYDIRTLRLLLETMSAAFHALLICYGGQRMTDESEKVANAAFEANFSGTDLRFQKCLVLIIRRSQNVTRIKAGKLIDTSLITFAWILRTSYSIYTVLRKSNGTI